MKIEQKHLDARHKILDEVTEASNVFFAPNQARFINDAMEMYAMYRTAELSKENVELKYKINTLGEDLPLNVSDKLLSLGECLRDEFLLNTQNYPKEYHDMFHKKFERAEKRFKEQYRFT